MLKLYDITKADLNSKPFTAGAFYVCGDTGELFLDSERDNARIPIASDILFLTTEANRLNLLAPVPNKIYCILESSKLYISDGVNWSCLSGGDSQKHISNIVVDHSTNTFEYVDSSITKDTKAIFIPDLSITDLVSNVSVSCTTGKATITLESDYDIIGELIIN